MMLEKECDKNITCRIQPDFRRSVKSGEYPLIMIIYSRPYRRSYRTGLYVSQSEWKKINSKRLQNELLIKKRNAIYDLMAKANKIISLLRDNFTFEDFYILIHRQDNNYDYQPARFRKPGVYDYFEKKIQELEKENRIGSAMAYNRSMISLKLYREILSFDDVTVSFLKKYELMMLSRGQRKSTIGIYLRHLRAIMNIAKNIGLISKQQYPFGKNSTNKYEIPDSRRIPQALEIHEIAGIINYIPIRPEEEWGRDMWLFSFFANGMNMVDIFNLKYKNIRGDFLYFVREKTKNTCKLTKEIEVYITTPMKGIIERWGTKPCNEDIYIFGVLDFSMSAQEKKEACMLGIDIVNKKIKRIAKSLRINKRISTSVARYSWATTLLRQGVPMTYISKGLGHTSYSTTERYLADFDQDKKIEVGNMLFHIVNKKLSIQ